jgi:hypothetical protein
MIAVMFCSVIIFMQQAMKHRYRFFSTFCFLKFATRPYQAFVTVGYVASAGITHISSPNI